MPEQRASKWPVAPCHGIARVAILLIAFIAVLAWGLAATPSAGAVDFCPTSISYGQTIECTLDSAGEVDSYPFAGVAGDVLRVRAIGTSGNLVLDPEVRQPDGTQICTLESQKVTCRLDVTGTHTIRVTGRSLTGTGYYTLYVQRLSNPVGCPGLTFGALPTNGALEIGGEMDCFTITGAVNDRIRIQLQSTADTLGSPTSEVVQASGTTVCSPISGASTTCRLPAAGSHTILVTSGQAYYGPPGLPYPYGSSGGTGTYAIAVQRLNSPVGCVAIAYGAPPVSGTLNSGGEIDCFTFSGADNDQARLQLTTTAGSGSGSGEIFGPDGTTICGPTPLGASVVGGIPSGAAGQLTCELGASGAHALLLTQATYPVYYPTGTPLPSTNLSYTLRLQRLNNPVGCTPLAFSGTATTGTIDPAGETHCFTFTGVLNDRVRARTIAAAISDTPTLEVFRPDGKPCTSAGAASPNYGYGYPTFAPGEITCAVDLAGTHAAFVRVGSGTSGPCQPGYTWNGYQCIYGGGGSGYCTTGYTWDGTTCVASEPSTPGQYHLVVQRLTPPPTGCRTLPLSSSQVPDNITLSDSITPPLEMDCFAVTLTASEQVRVDLSSSSSGLSPRIEVWQPNGSLLCSTVLPPGGSVPPGVAPPNLTCTVTSSGTHAVLVSDAGGRGNGAYTIGVRCLAGACPTVGGSGFTIVDGGSLRWTGGNLQTGYVIDRWSFPSGAHTQLPALPASATTYQDTPSLASDTVRCYTVTPVVNPQSAASDLLCWIAGSGSPTGPRDFSLQFGPPGAATLAWMVPTASFTSYQLVAVDLTTGGAQTEALGPGSTSFGRSTSGHPACYILIANTGSTTVGTTSVLCGIPASVTTATAASPSTTAQNIRAALSRAQPAR